MTEQGEECGVTSVAVHPVVVEIVRGGELDGVQ